MPPRKNTRKSVRKPTLRKAKAVVGKAKKRASKTNQDTFALKVHGQIVLTPTQGATHTNYMYRNFPLLDKDGSAAMSIINIPEFNLYRLQYDRVRVNSLTVKFVPKANVLDLSIAQEDMKYSLFGDGMYHTVIDRDGKAPASVATMERYPSYKASSLLKGMTRTYTIKWPTGTWMDCADMFLRADGGLSDLNRIGAFGGIGIYATDIIEDAGEVFNEPWADAHLTWNVVFQGKTGASLGYDHNTGVMTLTPQESVPLPDESAITIVSGFEPPTL